VHIARSGRICSWLERKVRQTDVTQTGLFEFVRRALAHLIEKRSIPLSALVRWKFVLAKVLIQKISQHCKQAANDRHQETFFGPQAAVETSFRFEFDFGPTGYAPH
jgi:type III restriction enzyme